MEESGYAGFGRGGRWRLRGVVKTKGWVVKPLICSFNKRQKVPERTD
jgi:hypothetical protein